MGKILNTVMGATFALTITDAAINKSRFSGKIFDVLVSEAQAETGKIAHISAPDQIAENWSANTLFYIQGDVPISENVLKALQAEFLAKYPDTQYTFFFMGENPSNFRYTNREGQNLRGKDAVEYALGEELISQTSLGIGKKHIVLWISFAKDNNGDRWARPLTSREFDEVGIGENSSFASQNGPLFSKVFPQLKDGNFAQAIQIFTQGYEEKYTEIKKEEKQAAEYAVQALKSAKEKITITETSLISLGVLYNNFLGKTPPAGWANDIESFIRSAENSITNSNGQGALNAISQAQNAIDNITNLIENHENFVQKVTAMKHSLQEMKSMEYADQAEREYQTTNTLLQELQIQWESKDILSYENTYRKAFQALEGYNEEITQAKITAERTKRNEQIIETVGTGALGLGGIAGLLAGWRLNRRRKPTKEQFDIEMKKWKSVLSKAQEKLMKDIIPKSDLIVELLEDSQDTTKVKVQQLGKDVGTVSIILAKLMQTLRDIEEQVGSSLFSKGPYEKGLKMLQNAEIQIDPILDGKDEALLEVTGGEDIATLRGLADKMSFTFEDMVAEADSRLERITKTFLELEEANANYEQLTQSAGTLLQDLSESIETLHGHTGRKVEIIFPGMDRFISQVNAFRQENEKTSAHDKIGAYDELETLFGKIKALVDVVVEINAYIVEYSPVLSRNLLNNNGYSVEWLSRELESSFKVLSKNAEKILEKDVSIDDFKNLIGAQRDGVLMSYEKVISIKELGRKLDEKKQVVIGLQKTLSNLKNILAEKYNIDTDLLFQEKGFDPQTSFSAIDTLYQDIENTINKGDVESGSEHIENLKKEIEQVREIMRLTELAFETYDENLQLSMENHTGIEGQKSSAKKALSDIELQWAKSVQKLRAGDLTHPNSDGFIGNNIDEIEANLSSVEKLLGLSQGNFKGGKVITAQNQLTKSQSLSKDSEFKIQEIYTKKESIEKTDIENIALIEKINSEIEKLHNELGNESLLSTTGAGLKTLLKESVDTLSLQEEEKRNPFEIHTELVKLMNSIANIQAQIKQDEKAKRDVDEQLKSLDSQLQILEKEGKQAQFDSYPDSKDAQRVFESSIPTLQKACTQLLQKSQVKNSNWYEMLESIQQVEKKAIEARRILSLDEKNRDIAEKNIGIATEKIRDARNWRVSHGVSIHSNIGSSLISQAEQAFVQGDFNTAASQAHDAYKKANSALEDAERRLRTKIREIEEEEERERRAERKRRDEAAERARKSSSDDDWSSGSSSSGFGGGGSFGGGSSGFGGGGSW